MAFELWEEDLPENPLWVRISKNGSIVLSKALKNKLDTYIQIMFDKKAKLIQFKAVAKDEKGARYVEKQKIKAKPLIDKLGIKFEGDEELKKYDAELKEDGSFVIKLS